MTRERLTTIQIATMKHLAVCCADGTLVTLTRHQRTATTQLWRRGLIEVWQRLVPDEGVRGPFYRPTRSGWALIEAIINSPTTKGAAA